MILEISVAVVCSFLGWVVYTQMKPPAPKVCGSPGGPPITSPRVRLNDGRHLSYREWGVSKDKAMHKIIIIHGFNSSKDLPLPISQGLIEEMQIYFLSFDRAGYAESDPYPKRTVKSEAFDIQELADKLQVGPKFHIIGLSLGAYALWGCLKYIPHRLSGAALVVPFVSYWWPCLPVDLSKEVFEGLLVQDQWAFRVAHYAPWLFQWWMTQKMFPSLSMLAGNMDIFSKPDLDALQNLPDENIEKIRQQGVYESLYRDLMASFGKWEFDPLDIGNHWPDNNGAVHIWHGFEDKIIPYQINRFLSEKLPFVRYHEVPDKGHFFFFEKSFFEEIVRSLLIQ